MPILIATVSVAVIGLIIGILLVFIGKRFAVEIDEREAAIRNFLPGNNCGGCGYAGCDALAAAISSGEAPVTACPVGGAKVADEIGQIMGIETEMLEKKVAYVMCAGNCDTASQSANYVGIHDCASAVSAGLSPKGCSYGCLGFGSCVQACPYNAIHIVNGIARVNRNACLGCGLCVASCPKHLIELIPDASQYAVRCVNKDKGAKVKKVCTAGCIGCGICQKQCANDAVQLTGSISKIDYEKCQNCGKCAEKCPVKVIEKRF